MSASFKGTIHVPNLGLVVVYQDKKRTGQDVTVFVHRKGDDKPWAEKTLKLDDGGRGKVFVEIPEEWQTVVLKDDHGNDLPVPVGGWKKRHAHARRRAGRYTGLFLVALPLGGIAFVLGGIVAIADLQAKVDMRPLAWGLILMGGAAVVLAPSFKARARDWSVREEYAEFERDLENLERAAPETKADRLWRKNQQQLTRYHETNLQQNAWALGIGVFCVFLGAGVAIVALWLVKGAPEGSSASPYVAGLGAIGTILSSFVGASFLKMYTASSTNLASFYQSLVDAQRLLLSNVVAAQIKDDEKRHEAYSLIAGNMIKPD